MHSYSDDFYFFIAGLHYSLALGLVSAPESNTMHFLMQCDHFHIKTETFQIKLNVSEIKPNGFKAKAGVFQDYVCTDKVGIIFFLKITTIFSDFFVHLPRRISPSFATSCNSFSFSYKNDFQAHFNVPESSSYGAFYERGQRQACLAH